MKKINQRPLVVNRETIRMLDAREMRAANGGASIVVADCPKWPDPPMMAPTEVTRCYDCPPP